MSYSRFAAPALSAKTPVPVVPLPVVSPLPASSNPMKNNHAPVTGISYSGLPITVDKNFRVTGLIRIGLKRVYTLSDLSERPENSIGKNFRMVRYDDSWQVGDLVQVGDNAPHWSAPSNPLPIPERAREVSRSTPAHSVPFEPPLLSSFDPVPGEPLPASVAVQPFSDAVPSPAIVPFKTVQSPPLSTGFRNVYNPAYSPVFSNFPGN